MSAINLLPEELSPARSIIKIANYVKKIYIPVFAVFLISVAVMLGVIIILNNNLKNIKDRQEILTTSIKSLEKTERGILFLKERLSKIKGIMADDTSKSDFTVNVQDILSRSQGVTITEIKAVPKKINLTVKASISDEIEIFLSQILENPLFKEIKLSEFSFSPINGYSFALELTTK